MHGAVLLFPVRKHPQRSVAIHEYVHVASQLVSYNSHGTTHGTTRQPAAPYSVHCTLHLLQPLQLPVSHEAVPNPCQVGAYPIYVQHVVLANIS